MGGDDGQDPRDENPLIPSGPEGSSGVWDLSGAAARPDSSLPLLLVSRVTRGTKGQVWLCSNLVKAGVMNDVWRILASGLASAAITPGFALSAAFTIAVLIVYHVAIARRRSGQA